MSAVLLKGFARLSPGCRAFGEARLRLFRAIKLEKDFTFAIGGISIVGVQVDGLLVGSQGLLRALKCTESSALEAISQGMVRVSLPHLLQGCERVLLFFIAL